MTHSQSIIQTQDIYVPFYIINKYCQLIRSVINLKNNPHQNWVNQTNTALEPEVRHSRIESAATGDKKSRLAKIYYFRFHTQVISGGEWELPINILHIQCIMDRFLT